MILQVGDDGVVSSVDEEELVYVDKNELEEFIEQYRELEKEIEALKDLNNQELQAYQERVLSVIDDAISKHHLDDDDIEDNLPYYMNVKGRIEALQDLRKELSE